MDSKIQLAWVQHLKTQEERAEFEQLVRNSTQVLGRLKDILQRQLDGLYEVEEKSAFYEGEVSHKQTYIAAQRAEIKNLLKLFSFI